MRKAAILLLAILGGCSAPKPPPVVHLTVSSDGDFLAFKPGTLTVPTGARVILTFHHAGRIISQKHDWVLTDKGHFPGLLADSDRAAAGDGAAGDGAIKPGDSRVVAASPLIAKGETTTIEFTAPAPGDYPFFCSTPGHGDTMQGVLHVTAG